MTDESPCIPYSPRERVLFEKKSMGYDFFHGSSWISPRGDGEGVVDSQALSDTVRYIDLTGLVIGLVVPISVDRWTCVYVWTRIVGTGRPMYLCVCVREDLGDGEDEDSESLSDTLRYINLVGVVMGLVTCRGPMYLCTCVSEERGDGEDTDSQGLSDTKIEVTQIHYVVSQTYYQ